jgi:hypothetical protein
VAPATALWLGATDIAATGVASGTAGFEPLLLTTPHVALPSELTLNLASNVVVRVARIALFITIGVFAANLVVAYGLVEHIVGLSRYLTRPANLPDAVGTAILTTAASTTAGYGMLADFRESGLTDRATLVAVTINTFFGFVQHIFTFYAPVLIPILGLEAGLLYVGARAGIALAITATGVLGGALLLDPSTEPAELGASGPGDDTAETSGDGSATDAGGERGVTGTESDDASEAQSPVAEARSGTARTLRRVLPRLLIVYTLVAVLTATVDLTRITAAGDPLVAWTGLPAASVPVIAVFALDTTSGAATIAPLIGDAFTVRTAVATMLIGGIVSFAVSTFKRSIPFQYGIWGPSFGSTVIIVNTALKVVWIAVAVVLVLHVPWS